jgi:Xaa-Pro aminopeptidase
MCKTFQEFNSSRLRFNLLGCNISAMSPFNQRIQPLRDLMKAKNLDAFVLRRNPNLSWATAGRSHVPTTIDADKLSIDGNQDRPAEFAALVSAAGGRLPGSNRVNPEALNYDDQITITDQVFAQLGF